MLRRSMTNVHAILRLVGYVCLALVAASQAHAQQPWTGEMGVTETVRQLMERERVSKENTRTFKPARNHPNRGGLPQNPDSPWVPRWPFDGNWNPPQGSGYPSTFVQHIDDAGAEAPQTTSTAFTAANIGASGFIPPDTMGDVSPTQILTAINGRVRVFDKNGVLGALNVSLNTFFNSVRNAAGTADPIVVWDRTSSRWFVSAITTSVPNRVVLAVSNGATITDTSSFTFYFFQHDLVGTTPNADTGGFSDYVSLGVDVNACYLGGNIFNSSLTAYLGTTGYVVRKSSVLSGGPIVVTAFRQMAPASGEGPYAPRGVTNDDPAATEGYFIGSSNAAFGRLTIRRISNPGGTPTISGNILLTVPATVNPQNIPAQGSTIDVEVTDGRLFQARFFRNRSTGVRTLWTSHSLEVNTSGVASTTGNRDGARWYQIGNLTGTPSLLMSGTLFDPTADAVHYVFPSCAMSGQGHMAMGVSSGGPTEFMGASTAGRLASDAAGTTQARLVLQPGAGSYTVTGSGTRNRWGDYSATVVDPQDDQSIWTFQEFVDATNSWAVRVVKLMAPPPVTPTSVSPNTIAQGASNVNLTVTGTSVAGSAFYDTEPGLNRIAASFSGAGITVNSVTRNSDTSVTVNVTVAGGAATGARNITITNPDGQSATGTGLLTVTGVCVPPSISAQPGSQTVCSGGAASFSVTATGTGPFGYQWRKNGVNVGGATSSTLFFAATTPADAGNYDCVVTNACGGTTSNVAVLTVNIVPSITGNPTSLSQCAGTSAVFTMSATGTPTPSLQWRKNTVPIPGATGSTYTIASITPADAGTYDCVATNTCGSATTTGATLTVHVAPVITAHPVDFGTCAGQNAIFSVTVSSTTSLTYQWRRNGVPIPGANSGVYTIASTVPADAGSYDCEVTNTCGTVTSNSATLSVGTAPTITSLPPVLSACTGGTATYTVTTTGTPTPSLQWRRNGVDIPGATSATFTIAGVGPADAGTYECVATSPCGVGTTNGSILDVQIAPTIVQDPPHLITCAGGSATFSVVALGNPVPTYQWRFNGNTIAGATSDTLVINSAGPGDAGAYDCIVTNTCGSVTTNAGSLVVEIAPAITSQPSDNSVCAGQPATFVVSATGTGNAYQWYFNGNPISGGTTDTLTIPSVGAGDAGSYYCVVTNNCGSETSLSATLSVSTACCDSIDFNNDGLFPDALDIDDFLIVFGGGPCSNDPFCNDIDFNNDGLFPDALDIDSLLSVFSGGACL